MNTNTAIATVVFIVTLIIGVGTALLVIQYFTQAVAQAGGDVEGYHQLVAAFTNAIGILGAVIILAVVALLVAGAMWIIRVIRQEAGVRE
ncbi:MAG: hypothetical protein QXT13_10145 [Pyrobaculum sp.]